MGEIITAIGNFMWGIPMILFLAATHLIMTYKTGFIQKHTFKAIKLSLTKDKDSDGDISQFQALTTALASTIGTGNIIGLGTAIALGGAGAVFWCWITGVFGIATKYAEALIAVKYRVKTADGRTLGGAMYVLENKLNKKFLAKMFAFCTILTSFGVGCGVQINAISEVVENTLKNSNNYSVSFFDFTVPALPLFVGIIGAILVCMVIFGGVTAISSVCERTIPVVAGLYLLGNIVILIYNFDVLPDTFALIVKSAFTKTAAAGGLVGYSVGAALRYGVSRGLMSNESGIGSAPIIAAAAQTKNPVRQALVSSTGTFWDTVVLCLITGLVLVSSIVKNDSISVTTLSGGDLTSSAFAQIPYIGTPILVFGMISFAFSTILGWSYYGERCAEYLFGRKAITPYRIIYVSVLAVAPLISLNVIWDLGDILNALMSIPNLTALLLLRNVVRDETKKYINNLDKRDNTELIVVDR